MFVHLCCTFFWDYFMLHNYIYWWKYLFEIDFRLQMNLENKFFESKMMKKYRLF